jgi:threonine dehydratase
MDAQLQAIYDAREAIKHIVLRTPLIKSHVLSDVLGYDVYLKLESLQVTGAFKIRGCYNKIRQLPSGTRGIIAASSGSHGIASALAARMLGIPATVVMPETSPIIKRKRVQGYGAELVIHGQTYDDAYDLAKDRAESTGCAFVPSFDDVSIIQGQGTIGLELLEDRPAVDLIVCPVGGGGLYAGVLLATKSLRPEVPVWGVQAEGAQTMAMSMKEGTVVRVPSISTIADAIAVKAPGRIPFEIIKKYGDGVATVDDEAILEATGRLCLWAKVMAEPAGAAGLAADWRDELGRTPKAAVFIVSGGNIATATLKRAMEACEEWPSLGSGQG